MADRGGGISGVFLGALAAVLTFGFVSCSDGPGVMPAAATGSLTAGGVIITNSAQMATMPGEDVAAMGVRVQHVAADEGFWVDLVGGRVWVQLITPGESPYLVRDGDIISFRGRVVAHNDAFPNGLGMCTPADAAALAAEDTHIDVPVNALAFGVG